MSDRLRAVIASVLDLAPTEIGDDASPDTIASWDSVKQMDMMLAVEDEFQIRFEDEQIAKLTSYIAIRDAVAALKAGPS